jgi:hypothetical protein
VAVAVTVLEDVKRIPANSNRYLSWTRDERVAVRNFRVDLTISILGQAEVAPGNATETIGYRRER